MENQRLHHLTIYRKSWSKAKNGSLLGSLRSFSKLTRSRFETHSFSSNDLLKQIFLVSPREMLVNNEVMPMLAIKLSEFCWSISFTKSNGSLTGYSLEVKCLSIVTRNLAILYVGGPMAESIFTSYYKLQVTNCTSLDLLQVSM